jgi:hypothetical protein
VRIPRLKGLAVAVLAAALVAVGGVSSASATETATPYAPPVLVGDAVPGGILSVDFDGWYVQRGEVREPVDARTHYQWLVDESEIAGETRPTLSVTAALLNHNVSVRLTGTATGGGISIPMSRSSPLWVAQRSVTLNPPKISGDTTVGSTLTAKQGTSAPASTVVTFQWYRGNDPIAGATGTTYTATLVDAGSRIWVRTTGTAKLYLSRTADSKTIAIDPVTWWATGVSIRGTSRPGSVLSAGLASNAFPGVAVGYQWLRNGRVIGGATGSDYAVTAADAAAALTVRVTSEFPALEPESVYSGSMRVTPGIPSAPRPTISGTAKVGRKLTVKPGRWTPASTRFTYQWYAGALPIGGATRATLKVPKAAAGKKIMVRVTGVKSTAWRGLVTQSTNTKKVRR